MPVFLYKPESSKFIKVRNPERANEDRGSRQQTEIRSAGGDVGIYDYRGVTIYVFELQFIWLTQVERDNLAGFYNSESEAMLNQFLYRDHHGVTYKVRFLNAPIEFTEIQDTNFDGVGGFSVDVTLEGREDCECELLCEANACETGCEAAYEGGCVTGACETGCRCGCELYCEVQCEQYCESAEETDCAHGCESVCQTGCETICQSECETGEEV